jgi:hypothetical protein
VGLDLGRRLGVAVGPPGFVPASYTLALSKPSGGLAVQAGNLIAVLDLILSGVDPRDPARPYGPKPALVVKEAAFSLAAFRDHAVNEAAVLSAFGLHAIVAGMCQRHGVQCRDAHVATVTKHFLGKGRWAGGRAERKNAIVRRCQDLGYFGRDCSDDDRADACAVWDWASVTLARVPPREIRLFGQERAA